MKWPEEEREEDEYHRRYRAAADTIVARYLTAPWRRAAVASIRKLIEVCLREASQSRELPRTPDGERLRDWLDANALSEVTDELSRDDSDSGLVMDGALLAEAAGILFCNRPTVLRWQLVGRIIESRPLARRILVDLVERRILKRRGLRDDIRKVARKIVQQMSDELSALATGDEHATFSAMHQHWQGKPSLHEIWFGLRSLNTIMPVRRDWCIFDLLFALDTGFGAELIESIGDPYQPALILQSGALNPHRRFANWRLLVEAAVPAFENDGAWNGRVLLPLVLLAAQDAMRSGFGYRNANGDEVGYRDKKLADLANGVAEALWPRSDGAAAALRWGGWLFRSMLSQLDGERLSFPKADSRAYPAWLTIQELLRSPGSAAWLNIRPADLAPEDELCLEAVRILAAQEHGHPVPGRELLLQMLPERPEDFFEGESGRRVRELPSLFTIWGKSPDAFGTRVLAAALFDPSVAIAFADLWRRTLTLREIAEHSHAFDWYDNAHDDHARRASETIRFVIALGINLLDYVQDVRQTVAFEDRRATALALFSILHDATREMLATDPLGKGSTEYIHNHLSVRRHLYEVGRVAENAVAAPLEESDYPTVGDLLCERCEISRSFFANLQMLRANGVKPERIESALASVGVQLNVLIEQAQRLNAIEHTRTIDLTGFQIDASTNAR